eukprot:CAMPEP_0170488036 /NCGR_PEP_ID=MMETSP0208-20121228/6675_1 /TAXON_ID=197538 /ORGANISM="Strombidium inclinatum, Strain S3" /LENGTH=159 /DNA_ID=CAMNT_0010762469 /DNA_START=315 /DNA_END=794 /DNA_ORIENTATION=+
MSYLFPVLLGVQRSDRLHYLCLALGHVVFFNAGVQVCPVGGGNCAGILNCGGSHLVVLETPLAPLEEEGPPLLQVEVTCDMDFFDGVLGHAFVVVRVQEAVLLIEDVCPHALSLRLKVEFSSVLCAVPHEGSEASVVQLANDEDEELFREFEVLRELDN